VCLARVLTGTAGCEHTVSMVDGCGVGADVAVARNATPNASSDSATTGDRPHPHAAHRRDG